MRKISIILTVALLLLFTLSVYALATLTDDAYIDTNDASNTHNGSTVSLAGSNFGGSCLSTQTAYFQFDLSTVSGEVSNATTNSVFKLPISSVTSASGNLVLYSVTNDAWDESTLVVGNAPALGTNLGSVATPGTSGTVTFTSAAFVTFLNEQTSYTGGGDTTAGDNVASFAVRIENCTGFVTALSVTGGATDLDLFNPTAVELNQISATSGFSPNLLIVLAFALPLLIGLVLLIMRRTYRSV